MNITPVNVGVVETQASRTSAPAVASSMNYDAFLRLLVAQMKNQDPLNPTDSTQFMSQLASFASVEQTMQMNEKLAGILNSIALGEAGSLVGRTVATVDGSLGGRVASVEIAGGSLTAILDDGRRFPINGNVIVGDA